MIKQLQRTAVLQNANMAGAALVGAQADSMRAAASNSAGAMTGFMGMGMAMNAGGINAQNLYAMGQQQAQKAQQTPPQAASDISQDSWKCSCGATVTGKFCPECGAKKPQPVSGDTWKCRCGAINTGKFCQECGLPKPVDHGEWTCPQCGKLNQGKFCQNCGTKKPE